MGPISSFTADDGCRLTLHLRNPAPATSPLVCLPGGPMLDAAYLGDLGGLDAVRPLALLDPRGTGDSEPGADPAAYRCDRMVADVEALRRHLGLDRLELLAHSAGANLAYRYAEAHPRRVARLVLVTPSPRGVGVQVPDQDRDAMVARRAGEAWYPEVAAAYARVLDGTATEVDWQAMEPLSFGRWDEAARAYSTWMDQRRHADLAEEFVAGYDPVATRAALSGLDVPVLVLAGDLDVGNPPSAMTEVAGLFPQGRLVVQPGAGHFPWVDDPGAFVSLLAPFVT